MGIVSSSFESRIHPFEGTCLTTWWIDSNVWNPRRLGSSNDAELVIGDGVRDRIKARCTEIESGGRMIDVILTNTLLPELSRGVLNRSLEGEKMLRSGAISRPNSWEMVECARI